MCVSDNLGCATKSVGPEEISYISKKLGNACIAPYALTCVFLVSCIVLSLIDPHNRSMVNNLTGIFFPPFLTWKFLARTSSLWKSTCICGSKNFCFFNTISSEELHSKTLAIKSKMFKKLIIEYRLFSLWG